MQTVLVIDDTAKVLEVVREYLEEEGYRVLTTPDPMEGVRLATENRVDLLLLDIMMPGMDGYTVCDQLKKDSKTRDIPVIMLTAKAVILHTPKDFFYGLYGFIAKPFSKGQLVRIVRDILRMTRAPGETAGSITPVEGDGGEERDGDA